MEDTPARSNDKTTKSSISHILMVMISDADSGTNQTQPSVGLFKVSFQIIRSHTLGILTLG